MNNINLMPLTQNGLGKVGFNWFQVVSVRFNVCSKDTGKTF